MKIFNITAADMGNNQQEIADKVYSYIQDREFNSQSEFDDIEYDLITKACKDLGWDSVPQTGGLIVEWDT